MSANCTILFLESPIKILVIIWFTHIISGDLNAKVEMKTKEDFKNMGTFEIGHRNDRWDRLIKLTEEHTLCLANTLFKKEKNPGRTHGSHQTEKQKARHILLSITKEQRRMVTNCEVITKTNILRNGKYVKMTLRMKKKKEKQGLYNKKQKTKKQNKTKQKNFQYRYTQAQRHKREIWNYPHPPPSPPPPPLKKKKKKREMSIPVIAILNSVHEISCFEGCSTWKSEQKEISYSICENKWKKYFSRKWDL